VTTNRVELIRLSDPIDPKIEREWRALLDTAPLPWMYHEPDWLRFEFATLIDKTYAMLLYEGDKAVALVTFVLKKWPLRVRIGEVQVAPIPFTRCVVLDEPIAPEDPAVFERMFRALGEAKIPFDAVYLEVIVQNKTMDNYLRSNAVVAGAFREYRPQGMLEHHQIHFPKTIDEYWEKNFSPKTKRNLQRKVRKLGKDLGKEIRLERCDSPANVDRFVRDAISVSKRSYQYHLLGLGIQDPVEFERRARGAAEKGWLRGYILYAGDEPIAFMFGYQYRGVYLYVDTAYDQAMRQVGPGTVLHVMVIEDMYAHDCPRIFEFGTHGDQKATFGNFKYYAGQSFLIHRAPYPQVAAGLYRASNVGTEVAKKVLDRFGVTRKLKQTIRKWSVRGARFEEPAAEEQRADE
jgi:hypothetical protein